MGENVVVTTSALLTAGATASAVASETWSTIIMTIANAVVLIINAILSHKSKKKAANNEKTED